MVGQHRSNFPRPAHRNMRAAAGEVDANGAADPGGWFGHAEPSLCEAQGWPSNRKQLTHLFLTGDLSLLPRKSQSTFPL